MGLLGPPKVTKLGASREVFDRKITDLYGPNLTPEYADHLFLVYSTCSRASPNYQSKNKHYNRNRNRNRGGRGTEVAEVADGAGQNMQEESSERVYQVQAGEATQETQACEATVDDDPMYLQSPWSLDADDTGVFIMPAFGCERCGSEDLHGGVMMTTGYRCHICASSASSSWHA